MKCFFCGSRNLNDKEKFMLDVMKLSDKQDKEDKSTYLLLF